jgi:hypothetical protein
MPLSSLIVCVVGVSMQVLDAPEKLHAGLGLVMQVYTKCDTSAERERERNWRVWLSD